MTVYSEVQWERDSLAMIVCNQYRNGCVLWAIGPHIESEIREAGSQIEDLGLDDAPHGVSVWQGKYQPEQIGGAYGDQPPYSEPQGTFRPPTDGEWADIRAGRCPWDQATWCALCPIPAGVVMTERAPWTLRQKRVDVANQFLCIVSEHGRHFFRFDDRVSFFELDSRGHVWFVDSWRYKRMYTHRSGGWGRNFHNGGTLQQLYIELRKFIMGQASLPVDMLGPWSDRCCGGDLWGYGADEMEKVRSKCRALKDKHEQ